MSDEAKKEMPEKFKGLVDSISALSVIDLAELVKVLEDTFGVSAAAPMMMAAAPAAAGAAVEEKTIFDVELTSTGDSKINVIKVVKEALGVGLKDAKDLVDGAPSVLKTGMKKEDAEALKTKITEAGGTVTLK
ncbi:MAG: 50S ribosomal protein L7/L12 [Patescibacteria group bacterium]